MSTKFIAHSSIDENGRAKVVVVQETRQREKCVFVHGILNHGIIY